MIARLLAGLVLLAPAVVAAHGGHGPAAALPGTGAVTVAGYRVELASQPSPLRAGQPSDVVARVSDDRSGQPVTGGRVRIGLAPAGAAPPLEPAPEVTWAGSYTAHLSPERRGAHRVQVVLEALDGHAFAPPHVVEFAVTVEAAPGVGGAVWALVALVTGAGALGIYGVALRARLGRPGQPLSLLDVPWLRRLWTSPAFAPSLQVPLLLLTGAVVALGLFDVPDGSVNLATRLVWTVFWAGVIFTFVLVGRAWCLACPVGALNEWVARLADSVRRLPRPLRNIWWATGLFVVLTWADEQLGMVRSPRATAWLLVGVAAAAIAVGFFYERRSFCRYLCPLGGLIGLYSMTAPLELRSREGAVCAADREKACFRGSDRGPGCPMLEFPATMDRNTYCILCGRCVTGCAHDNVVLRLRAFGRDLWASGRRVLDEAYLAVVLAGLTLILTAGMLAAWPEWIAALAGWLPAWVRTSMRPVTYLGAVESLVLLGGSLVGAPALALGAAALADRLAGTPRLGARRAFVTFGYMFVPIGLALHLAHNLAHLLWEGGGVRPAVQRAVALYTPLSLGAPDWEAGPLAPEPVVAFVQMAIVAGFFVLSLVAGHRLALRAYPDPRAAARAFVPMAVLSLLLTLAGIALLTQPMGMRHGA